MDDQKAGQRTVACKALAEVDAADDAEDEDEERKDDGRSHHDAEEEPCSVRPAERRRYEHRAPASQDDDSDAQEDRHPDLVLLADRNPALFDSEVNQLDLPNNKRCSTAYHC